MCLLPSDRRRRRSGRRSPLRKRSGDDSADAAAAAGRKSQGCGYCGCCCGCWHWRRRCFGNPRGGLVAALPLGAVQLSALDRASAATVLGAAAISADDVEPPAAVVNLDTAAHADDAVSSSQEMEHSSLKSCNPSAAAVAPR